jgi:hypothetical protein
MVGKITLVKQMYAGGVELGKPEIDTDIPASEVSERKLRYVGGNTPPELKAGLTARFTVMIADKPLASQVYSFGRDRFMPILPLENR